MASYSVSTLAAPLRAALAAIPFLKYPVVFLRSPLHIAAQTNLLPDDDQYSQLRGRLAAYIGSLPIM